MIGNKNEFLEGINFKQNEASQTHQTNHRENSHPTTSGYAQGMDDEE